MESTQPMSNRHFTLTDAQAEADGVLLLTFADGAVMRVDLRALVAGHPLLFALSDPQVFGTVRVGEWGGSVVWGDDPGGDLELAADNLRARAVEQAGGVSHEFILNWMARHRLSLDAAAQALGLSRRMLAYYRSGEKPVPRTVALACLGWEHLGVNEAWVQAA
jgi:hypothetical protein